MIPKVAGMTLTTLPEVSYVLPVDKPVGPTSHDIVARARRALKNRRIGHTGTLDPFASGLLLLCVGNATRLAEYLTGLSKTYEAELCFGTATDTDDRTGTVVSTSDRWHTLGIDAINAAFAKWQGTHLQYPSQYSAKKVDGVRAYESARRGESVDIDPSSITIDHIAVTSIELPRVRFVVTCSSGTYVRALARDIGADLGVGAHLTSLRRTRVGAHDVARAIPIDALDDAGAVHSHALSSLDAIAHMQRVDIDDAGMKEISHGRVVRQGGASDGVSFTQIPPLGSDPVALVHNGELVAIAQPDGDVLRPKKVLANE